MILGRLITILDAAHLALIRPTWLTKIFVAGDVLSFAMQSTGGAMLAQKSSNAKMGKYAILAGLFAQIIFFNLFMIVTIIFHRRLNKAPTHASQVGTHWKKLLAALYAASLLILVRSVFRVVEYQQGREGYLLRKEVWLYLFDAVLMFFVGVIFNVVHPSIAVPGRKKSVEDGYALRSADGN
ncbi:RTA1 like protein [Choiromyces venosus 120613-1]|uniref:RTA1 like protein n=1 Tax=Choiromyces venosus 120613-1 TaxID=1336337 RepID=A0A3N4JNR5_9PEZI|nr:RTA1 like protein [Choiromyces venosus 120613-1]